MKRLLMALTIAALGLAYSGTAQAFTQTTTGSMNLAVTVVSSCTVLTAPMDFGSYAGGTTMPTGTSTITVNCTNGSPYRVDIGGGLNQYAGFNGRNLKTGTAPADATNSIFYMLSDSTFTEWGDNGITYCPACAPTINGKSGTGTGADQILTVNGSIQTYGNSYPAGSYSDTVTVTVNY